ncbi:MAG: hypothetical protein UX85_C0006G0032 [Candidatus Beckwithbacteria bacterium GW2011_GWB1_47_15]|uniref:Glycosyltransferase 2-like domain-containing protein n=1 Tax=Candidatus Beckwithbacteria bacterium GW2011_GWB1_47_15 TaxID=1618371 RepID=A0A0G1U3G3_9BACT|nr:MAG: family 2 glycosyltransferase, dolichol-phosphate mannosyltransferase [Candidatus Beckwithbacteria bacterium GW2011_GWC1_49_16]KKU35699.1 MAG: hypothetical protein UX50_C0002G0126 [Candidatus Beckwithbacteria bacterium GW2011_GWA1_46_30]KKU60898.1 MAG: hypothetical protein UX85_C0006G0032 [Candidatus Beckwithbacteria bacterium GW2011_GWB1_47_15]KKU72258.1 MAG: hypothetical protein UX97_C0001G0128 [Candidatus Beckwithbacteria bacterium GW2011_GWA2_47_25]KKW04982.1 MAG: hypothetical protei
MKLTVILPTYNEAGNIVKLIKAILKALKPLGLQTQVIVVDDNSPDGTAAIVKPLTKKLAVKLFVRKKRGLATAILYGLQRTHADIFVIMDTDFNHQPKDIPRLLTPIIKDKADLVIGSRYVAGGGMHASEAGTIQFLGSKWGNRLVNRIILGLPVHESLSGFIAFKKEILKSTDLTSIFLGYGEYCIRLLYRAHQAGFRLAEVPVVYGQRRYGQSKSRLLKMMIDYLITAVKLRLNL